MLMTCIDHIIMSTYDIDNTFRRGRHFFNIYIRVSKPRSEAKLFLILTLIVTLLRRVGFHVSNCVTQTIKLRLAETIFEIRQ